MAATHRYLRVDFTPEEVVQMREKISHNLQELMRQKDALTAIKKQLQGQIDLLEQETNLLADKSNAGYHMQNVACEMKSDWKNKRITVTRKDTGEIVEDRAMRNDELQEDAFEK